MSSNDDLGVSGSIRLGIVALTAAAVLLGAATFAMWALSNDRYDRSTAVASGTVVDVFGDDELEVTVAWTDRAGAGHRDDFYLYDGEDAREGKPFRVRYDPADPGGQVFPADADQAAGPGEDAAMTGLLGGAAGGLFLLGWAVRLWRNRAAAASAATPTRMNMVVLRAQSNQASKTYAVLVPLDRAVRAPAQELDDLLDALASDAGDEEAGEDEDPLRNARHQAVMWEPVLDEIAGAVTLVTVYADLDSTRRAVIELPDGHRLVPAGRLLRRRPRTWALAPRRSVLDRAHEDLRARAGAGDAAARARLAVLVGDLLGHEQVDPLGVPVAGPPSRTFRTAFARRPWIVLPACFVGWTSAGAVGVAVAVPCFFLLSAAFWAWNGADPAPA